ncbi:MAG TPA: RDD family protein [Actinomycetota bacterium]|nr:RDD family protein [Actinomycetota bacterium]
MSKAAVSGTTVFPAGAAERQGMLAGIVSRVGAMVIDFAYAVVFLGAAYVAYAGFRFMRDARGFTWPQPTFQQSLTIGATVVVLMLTISWSTTGRTMGMRLMGLRLLGRRRERIGTVLAFARALACVVFPLGLFWSAVSRRNASVQDLIFGTSVVYDWRMHVPAAAGAEPPATYDTRSGPV